MLSVTKWSQKEDAWGGAAQVTMPLNVEIPVEDPFPVLSNFSVTRFSHPFSASPFSLSFSLSSFSSTPTHIFPCGILSTLYVDDSKILDQNFNKLTIFF